MAVLSAHWPANEKRGLIKDFEKKIQAGCKQKYTDFEKKPTIHHFKENKWFSF
jgi:hypothetical protein